MRLTNYTRECMLELLTDLVIVDWRRQLLSVGITDHDFTYFGNSEQVELLERAEWEYDRLTISPPDVLDEYWVFYTEDEKLDRVLQKCIFIRQDWWKTLWDRFYYSWTEGVINNGV